MADDVKKNIKKMQKLLKALKGIRSILTSPKEIKKWEKDKSRYEMMLESL